MSVGIRFMMGTSKFQAMQDAVELHLAVQALRPLPISLVIGGIGTVLTLLFLDCRRFPAGLMVVAGGLLAAHYRFGASTAGSALINGAVSAALILGITLASNLAAGFIAGMAAAHLLRWHRLSV